MSARKIAKLLEKALLHDGEMVYALYKWELEEQEEFQKASMAKDKDDFIFSVTEHSGDVAIVLIEKSGQVHINEQARERLKEFWLDNYEHNIKMLLPGFVVQLSRGELPLTGVRTVHNKVLRKW